MTRSLRPGLLLFLAFCLTMTLLVLMGAIGKAFADNGATPPTEPVDMLTQLYQFMRTGKGTMAIGVANLLLVWALRNVLSKKIAWFGTMLGGYVLGFGTAALEYLGVGITTTETFTFGMILNAVGAGFVASGGWETLRDIITKTKKPVASTVAIVAILGSLIVGSSAGCVPGGPGPVVASAAIDCINADRERIDAALSEFAPLLGGGSVKWPNVYQRAKVLGGSVGACFLGELVNAYLGGRRAPETDDGWEARLTFEKFRREEVNNATLKTRAGDL